VKLLWETPPQPRSLLFHPDELARIRARLVRNGVNPDTGAPLPKGGDRG